MDLRGDGRPTETDSPGAEWNPHVAAGLRVTALQGMGWLHREIGIESEQGRQTVRAKPEPEPSKGRITQSLAQLQLRIVEHVVDQCYSNFYDPITRWASPRTYLPYSDAGRCPHCDMAGVVGYGVRVGMPPENLYVQECLTCGQLAAGDEGLVGRVAIDVPLTVRSGEPFRVTLEVAGPGDRSAAAVGLAVVNERRFGGNLRISASCNANGRIRCTGAFEPKTALYDRHFICGFACLEGRLLTVRRQIWLDPNLTSEKSECGRASAT